MAVISIYHLMMKNSCCFLLNMFLLSTYATQATFLNGDYPILSNVLNIKIDDCNVLFGNIFLNDLETLAAANSTSLLS